MSETPEGDTNGSGLKRLLGAGFGMAATLGAILGLGILRTPGEVAAVSNDPWVFVALWAAGGAFALLSVVVVVEVVAMNPRSGGYYVWIRQAFGPFPGFVMGWVDWLSFAATLALKSVVLAEYLALLAPPLGEWRQACALLLATAFALLQLAGVRLGARIQQLAAAMMAVIVVGFTLALLAGDPAPMAAAPAPRTDLAAWGLVVSAIVFTYDGWLAAGYFGGEIVGGGRAVAVACVRGVLCVTGLYLLLLVTLAFSVPLAGLAGSELALSTGLEIALSPTAGLVVLLAAVAILLAHLNLNYMQSSRILFALAEDGLGMRDAARVGRRGNPVIAVGFTWMVVVVLIGLGGFEFLLTLCAFYFVLLYVALIAGVAMLRRREPEAARPWQAPGHPWTTLACGLGWLAICGFQAVSAPLSVLYALGLLLLAWPAWRVLERARPGSGRAGAGL